jgi:hypothetical protein
VAVRAIVEPAEYHAFPDGEIDPPTLGDLPTFTLNCVVNVMLLAVMESGTKTFPDDFDATYLTPDGPLIGVDTVQGLLPGGKTGMRIVVFVEL